MLEKFSHITDELRKNMPIWSKARKTRDSVASSILNVIGLQFEDIEEYLQYALDNYHLVTADTKQIDLIYKCVLPKSINKHMEILVQGKEQNLTKMDELKMFYEGIDSRFLNRKEVYYPNPFFIDWDNNILYSKYAYEDKDFEYGKITLKVFEEGKLFFEYDLQQIPHQVWNFFDEFGLILDLQRIPMERNEKYKKRLLDVFLHVPNSSRRGMENSIANELGIRKSIKRYVKDVSEYELEYTDVLESSLRINRTVRVGTRVTDDIDRVVTVEIPEEFKGNDGVVQFDFISGLKLHEFHDKEDSEFQSMLYDIEGRATPMLRYYIDVINKRIPVMWGSFKWNESFWNIADENMSGHGAVPTFKDGRFLSWSNYKK